MMIGIIGMLMSRIKGTFNLEMDLASIGGGGAHWKTRFTSTGYMREIALTGINSGTDSMPNNGGDSVDAAVSKTSGTLLDTTSITWWRNGVLEYTWPTPLGLGDSAVNLTYTFAGVVDTDTLRVEVIEG